MQRCQMTAENFVLELSVAAEMLFIYSPRKENEKEMKTHPISDSLGKSYPQGVSL